METESVPDADYAACLRDLAAVNTVTLARLPTLGFLARAVRRAPGRELAVLDLACGEGDMLRRIRRWAARGGHAVRLAGLDASAQGIAAARAATRPGSAIAFHLGDALGPWPLRPDVVISSLFTHHLPAERIVALLRLMEARSALGWFVNDLHRHRLAFHGFRLLSTMAGWHRFVRHDGPVSVARGFRRTEWQDLLRTAGVPGTVRWHLPFRFCVQRLR